jgi:competence protein ComGC
MSTKNKNHIQKGFTLVEMAVVAPVVILVIGTFIYAIVTMTGDVMAGRAANVLAYNIQDTLNRIEADFRISKGYLSTNSFDISTPQGRLNDSTKFTTPILPFSPLIVESYATSDSPLSPTRSIIYKKDTPNLCNSTEKYQNIPLTLNIVYFVRSINNINTLWRRVIMPADYNSVGCGTPWQIPSCSIGSIDLFCKTNDEKLIEGLDSDGFNIVYDEFAGSIKPGAITVTIKATSTVAGRSITKSGTISAINAN